MEPGVGNYTAVSHSNVSASGATLTANFKGVCTDPESTDIGFRYGTSKSSLTDEVYYDETIASSSGSYSTEITGLEEGTTYYYQAFMKVWNGSAYEEIVSDVGSFTTQPATVTNDYGYLNCFEVPAISLTGYMVSGNEVSGRGYMWYRYMTTNSNRAVATHTYMYNGKVVRNYTVMLDGSKKAPVWTAHAMHASMWPDNSAGRNDGWTDDPAFTGLGDWQQDGVSGYSKGHLVASNYRQTSKEQNKQTFYHSNQAPQLQNGFNDSVWNELEQAVKASSPTGSDTLYVVTGVLYEGTPKYSDGIQIPSHFYKCLMKCSFSSPGVVSAAEGCAYVFENKKHSSSDYSKGITSIDEIESRAGFDFFPKIPKSLQDDAEDGITNVLSL